MDLEYKPLNVWRDTTFKEEIMIQYGEKYKEFLNKSKTERETVATIIERAKQCGFVPLNDLLEKGQPFKQGDKVFYNHKNKAAILMVGGKEALENGMNIVGSHVDSPHLDLKGHPLYEEGDVALLKTHYYGGIKKYQWTCLPLALHGVVCKKNGEIVHVCIGDQENDPVMYISDLMPHLGRKQNEKKLEDAITGEQLNAIIGHKPSKCTDNDENAIKYNILKIIKEMYDIEEEDLLLSELSLVPAQNAVDVGLDRSLIAAHGHDDRSCVFASLEALLQVDNPEITAVALFVDKEEIGSVGNTSMNARYFENMLAELFALSCSDTELQIRRAFSKSHVLSADVDGAFDSNFSEVFDLRNVTHLGHGIAICKYTGSRGKSGSNDANTEFLNSLRKVFSEHNILWQTGELGRVDEGGGGTIAYILANRGAEVVDCGIPMLSMHAPIELVSKADIYNAIRAYHAFFQDFK